ncbi:MAG: hypothetical protein WBW33_17620 [Bryobacteraceae bacterium]
MLRLNERSNLLQLPILTVRLSLLERFADPLEDGVFGKTAGVAFVNCCLKGDELGIELLLPGILFI